MTADRWDRAAELFERAREQPLEARDDFLRRHCGDDEQLRTEVESLLQHDDPQSRTVAESIRDAAADRVARFGTPSVPGYRVLQRIGAGGMGEVWLADQLEPVKRRVALKVIKLGMDTKQIVARFEAERQALALMDHASVAKVFDAGATQAGRPYFVMEYVAGTPITEHCDRNRLTTRERIELFIKVCEGVQHAHQKAILHRDLKPSNVLVSIQDGVALPKIIDFGIAKAISQNLTERTLVTELGAMVGTPEYMSPEQAELTEQGVDTRTDVYSLGVILYELLVGVLPFDGGALRAGGRTGIQRKLRSEVPGRPSTRLAERDERSRESARLRRADVAMLRRQLTGDLDWITMRALEKDRARRYATPSELAADLERHLRHQPVLAGPPSTVYRAKKFVRRHRFGVSIAAVALLALVGFAATMSIQASRIASQRTRAENLNRFTIELFAADDPHLDVGAEDEIPVDLERLEKRRADLLGSGRPATELLSERIEVAEGFRDARRYEAADELLRAIENWPRDEPAARKGAWARARFVHGDVLDELGQYVRAEAAYRDAIDLYREAHGRYDVRVVNAMFNLGAVLQDSGRSAEARATFGEAIETAEASGEVDDALLGALFKNLGDLDRKEGRYDAALENLGRALEIRERHREADPLRLASTLNVLGMTYTEMGRFENAQEALGQALAIYEVEEGPYSRNVTKTLNNLADCYKELRRWDEANDLFTRVLAIFKSRGARPTDLAVVFFNLGEVKLALGEYRLAEQLLRASLQKDEEAGQIDGPYQAETMGLLANAIAKQNRLDEAERHRLDEAERLYRRAAGILTEADQKKMLRQTLNDHAAMLRSAGRRSEAATIEERAATLRSAD